jgi:hypothetical protein
MGKIIITNHNGDAKIQIPQELIFLFKQSRARRFKAALTYDNLTKVLNLAITDVDWHGVRSINSVTNSYTGFVDRRKTLIVADGYISTYVRSDDRYSENAMSCISFSVQKGKGYTICEKIELDYYVYKNSDNEILITAAICLNGLSLNRREFAARASRGSLFSEVGRAVYNITSTRFYKAIDDVDEIYYYKHIEDNNIVYVTKEKYAFAIINGIDVDSPRLHRTTSLSKFFKDHFPEIPEANITAYLEYNKMLTSYDPSLLSIVSSDDIVKYYLQDSYFRMSGELGSSCMRDSGKSHVIKFYANNSNFRLLIMKAGQTDSIMARALLVTTTDGTVFMDRVYTVDTKLIGLFHRYAKENNIKNIYEVRNWAGSTKKNLMSQGPASWTKVYFENYKVDLDWIPATIMGSHKAARYRASINQNSNITSGYDLPYIDNFQYINAFTMQASVNPLNFFTNCDLSDELIDNNEVYYYNSKVYDRRFVDVPYDGKPTLKVDTVTLTDSDTLQAGDSDIDDNVEEDEEWLGWDDDDLDNDDLELEEDLDSEQEVEENPYTIDMGTIRIDSGAFANRSAAEALGITNYQGYNSLTTEEVARFINDASPELQVILNQINDIVTDSQQEQHLF